MSHDDIEAAAENLGTLMALEEATVTAVQQAGIITKILDLLTDAALGAVDRPVRTVYDEGRRDGEVELIKRLHALIKRERGE